MTKSFFTSLRLAFAPWQSFDAWRLFGVDFGHGDRVHDYALSADSIDVSAGQFHLCATNVRFRKGAITAVVGPNGAGKSTLLEALLGFRHNRGSGAQILGMPTRQFLADPSALRRLGAQLQKVEYADHTKVSEIVDLHRAMYRKQDSAVAAALALDELIGKPCRGLSKGQRQRVDLYVALAHRPELLILDEPFTGLDRRYTGVVSDLLRDRPEGTSVAMICHAGEDLSAVDDIVWVKQGGIAYQGQKDVLKATLVGEARALLYCRDDREAAALRERLEVLDGVVGVRTPQPLVLEVFGDATLHPYVQQLVGEQRIQHLELSPTTDNDLLRLCTEGLRHD
ncbi:phosphonate ABC transporter ATP-binding protein [Robbsia andropogonis]|uniref:Phosphonate ABC transporter ATP-binding protein n=1 Tax=Robbsia andropogonis TaxID=28092 RepID=A0A0F5K4E3_9BURK|nr:ABC transporter ATP-binding protein [Robbsia andropogonis]KKB64963.1 phosphonate ABC transporter ATP-binding protein [Robbsia andropogonis]